MLNKIKNFIWRYIKYFFRYLVNPSKIKINQINLDLSSSIINKNITKFIYLESYERSEYTILKDVLEETDKVMEIGAGIGYLSSYIAIEIGSDSIVAYEANPNLIDIINKNYKLNNVSPQINNLILSDKIGEETFYLEDNYWSSSIEKRSEKYKKIIVNTADINKEIVNNNINFLLVDIEGGEKDLIPKIKTFNKIEKIVIELHPDIIGDKEVSDIINILLNKGFIVNLPISKGDVYFFEKI